MPKAVDLTKVSIEGVGDEHAGVFSGFGKYCKILRDGLIDPVDGDSEFGEVEEHRAVFMGKETAVSERRVLEIDAF